MDIVAGRGALDREPLCAEVWRKASKAYWETSTCSAWLSLYVEGRNGDRK